MEHYGVVREIRVKRKVYGNDMLILTQGNWQQQKLYWQQQKQRMMMQ